MLPVAVPSAVLPLNELCTFTVLSTTFTLLPPPTLVVRCVTETEPAWTDLPESAPYYDIGLAAQTSASA
jgi:hypothetical protein